MEKKNELALVSVEDLSLVDSNSLNERQLQLILKKTPSQYVKQRPAKGGGQWDYVTGGYVKKCLNLLFGWDWDFEIVEQMVMNGEAIVKGRLTCRTAGKTIVKMQFGNKDVMCKKGTTDPLSIGNDLKAAATDCLKKCAAEIGIAADIYNKEDFREVNVDTKKASLEEIQELYELKKESFTPDEQIHIERIIEAKEVNSYKKLYNELKKK
jgi:hypothetical protein